MQKITDAPLRKCPECGRSTLKKLLSAPVFRLKGSGWYETDFKSDNEAKRNLVDERKDEEKKEAPTAGEAQDAPKADAKAEPKADAKAESKAERKAITRVESKAPSMAKGKAAPKARPRAKRKSKVARKRR
jgi:hypothetical protein